MTLPASAPLYSPELLAFAVELADYPYDADAKYIGEARSRSCGSVLSLSCDECLHELGMRVTACAVGQASAAIFARHASGKTPKELTSTLDRIAMWLAGDAELPEWPDFDFLAPARAFPGRHGAIVLPWKAALDALSNGGTGR